MEKKESLTEKLAEFYFIPRDFERKDDAKFYKRLGVEHFDRGMNKYVYNPIKRWVKLQTPPKENYNKSKKNLMEENGATITMESVASIGTLAGLIGVIAGVNPLIITPPTLFNSYMVLSARSGKAKIANALESKYGIKQEVPRVKDLLKLAKQNGREFLKDIKETIKSPTMKNTE